MSQVSDEGRLEVWVAAGSHATYLNYRNYNSWLGSGLRQDLVYQNPATACKYYIYPFTIVTCDIIRDSTPPDSEIKDYPLVDLDEKIATWAGNWGRPPKIWIPIKGWIDGPPPSPYHKTFDDGKSVMLSPDLWHDKFIKDSEKVLLSINP